ALAVSRRLHGREPPVGEVLMQPLCQAAAYPEARASLLRQGLTEPQLNAMPHVQVVALDAWRQYRSALVEYLKWIRVPYFEREPGFQQARTRFRDAVARLERLLFYGDGEWAAEPIMRPERVDSAVRRVERRFAALR